MKQILRYSFVALLAMVCGNVNAQEVTIDFSGDTDNWGIGTTKQVDEKSFTYNGYTIKLTGTTGNGYRWYDSGNIILGKQGATLELPAFAFDVERIDVVGTSGASASVKQNIYVGEDAVSTETTGAKNVTNEYKIATGNQTAGNVYVLKVTSDHNTQITKILIWKKGTSTETTIPEVNSISDFKALESGTKAKLTLTNAQIIGVGNKYMIVKDASGALNLYNTGLEFTLGQILNGTITGSLGEYKSVKQLTSMTENTLTATDGTITPTIITAASAASAEILSGPYKIENVILKKDGSNFYVMDGETKVIQVYDQFKSVTLDEGTYDIEGVIGYYNNIQLWVTKATLTSGVSAIKAEVDANAPAYNVAGQKVAEGYKGLVIKGGKKVIQK